MAERTPMALIIDDPPINSSYWMRRQAEEMGVSRPATGAFGTFVADWRRQEPSMLIPNDFWRQFAAWARDAGVKGKFTMLPCPAGLGTIDDRVEGYSAAELSELLCIVREELLGPFDITPEIWTHSMAWDMAERRLRPVFEPEWMGLQNEETLADYMAGALRVLQKVGLRPTGITQPGYFPGDRDLYARAVLRAMKEACGIKRTFFFLDCEATALPAPSRVMVDDQAAGESVVSIWSGIRADEPFWASLYGDAGDPLTMAEYFIAADGRSGRLVDLVASGGPAVFHAHGQTLFSNGTRRGFDSLKIVVDRVNRHLGDRIEWSTVQQVAEWTRRLV